MWEHNYGFWGTWQQSAFFDARVFNPCALSYGATLMAAWYRCHEGEKRREHEQCGHEIEQGSFTPLCSTHQEGWAELQPLHTGDWYYSSPQSESNNTGSWCFCSDAAFLLHCLDLQWCAWGELDQGRTMCPTHVTSGFGYLWRAHPPLGLNYIINIFEYRLTAHNKVLSLSSVSHLFPYNVYHVLLWK